MRVLEMAWPEWLSAAQVHHVVRHLRPDYGADVRPTGKALSRLHGLKLVERTGARYALVGRVKGTRSGSGYLMRPGYRYRLIIRAEDLL